MVEDKGDAALDTLRSFFIEMHQWEAVFYAQLRLLLESDAPQSRVDAVQSQARIALVDIYNKYGITGKKNRNRIEGLNLSDPPTYEIAPDIVERMMVDAKNVAYVVDKSTGLEGRYRYTLKNIKNQWVTVRREFLDHEQKWRIFSF